MHNQRFVEAVTRYGMDFITLLVVLTLYIALRASLAGESVATVANVLLFVLLSIGGIAACAIVELMGLEGSLRKVIARHYTWRRAAMVMLVGVVLVEAVARIA